jgi:hypothetical protein
MGIGQDDEKKITSLLSISVKKTKVDRFLPVMFNPRSRNPSEIVHMDLPGQLLPTTMRQREGRFFLTKRKGRLKARVDIPDMFTAMA